MKQRAAEEEQHTTRKERGVFFVSPDAYDRLHPENMTVALSAHAKKDLLHPPFDFSENKKRTRATVPAAVESPPTFVHPALWEKWLNFRQKYKKPVFTAEERGLLDLLQGYPDIMDCMRCWQNSESRREIFVLHLLNHWFKARSVVLAHDKIIEMFREQKKKKKSSRPGRGAKNKKKGETEEENCESLLAEEDDIFESDNYQLRDRGFSKTRLFVMLPMRNIALQYVKTIVEVLGADPLKCSKMEMFVSDFTEVEELADPTFKRRPLDYRRQFDGNIDDSFCVGLHLQPDKVSLYAHPLNSDIIICSPLGLRKRMERSGDIAVSLSSVEVCLVDEAHVLLLQNWDHPAAVMEMLNKRPTETTHGLSDLRRVYSWALEGKSGRHRQTIISSNVSHATLLGAFRGSVNSSGKVLLQPVQSEGAVTRVVGGIRQHFMRFDATALDKVDDERFNFFTESIFPTKINTLAERDVRIIIFVPSYFDFVRLRNYLYKEYRDTFAALSEYSSLAQQRQALGQFSDLERPVLLVTERFYFFKRYFVKLAEVMVFYSPPVMSEYYSDLINKLVLTSPNALSLTVYCRYDTHELSRLVGTARTRQLLERESNVYSFVTS
ncbi:Utp25, U3 small nucleolar RNA-associated SSU processome protein 25, putative [Angomonas deanei]|uniref:Utp25, U3 small nucleolar RNA-associated SSU processome protein 25, putative n=1 Tax=Angomonas deanei TaxID=59799 RepID=A0A7G2CN18_9TRYP|nr:Utp25, U3 small nucleolar RNA-associated SSU processome protein 25, putative [Angomonas deanei]